MSRLIILAACVALAAAGHLHDKARSGWTAKSGWTSKSGWSAASGGWTKGHKIAPKIPIVKLVVNDDNMGKFDLESLSADGTLVKEEGHLKDLGDPEGPVTVMSGSYSYIGDDKKKYTVHWTADERGFIATGDHLPVPPPIPEEILKGLAEIKEAALLPSKEVTYDDGMPPEVAVPLVKAPMKWRPHLAKPHVKIASPKRPALKLKPDYTPSIKITTPEVVPALNVAEVEPIIKITSSRLPSSKIEWAPELAPSPKIAYSSLSEPEIKITSSRLPSPPYVHINAAAVPAEPIIKVTSSVPAVKIDSLTPTPTIKIDSYDAPVAEPMIQISSSKLAAPAVKIESDAVSVPNVKIATYEAPAIEPLIQVTNSRTSSVAPAVKIHSYDAAAPLLKIKSHRAPKPALKLALHDADPLIKITSPDAIPTVTSPEAPFFKVTTENGPSMVRYKSGKGWGSRHL